MAKCRAMRGAKRVARVCFAVLGFARFSFERLRIKRTTWNRSSTWFAVQRSWPERIISLFDPPRHSRRAGLGVCEVALDAQAEHRTQQERAEDDAEIHQRGDVGEHVLLQAGAFSNFWRRNQVVLFTWGCCGNIFPETTGIARRSNDLGYGCCRPRVTRWRRKEVRLWQ